MDLVRRPGRSRDRLLMTEDGKIDEERVRT